MQVLQVQIFAIYIYIYILRIYFRKRGRSYVNNPLMRIENTKLPANFISTKSNFRLVRKMRGVFSFLK